MAIVQQCNCFIILFLLGFDKWNVGYFVFVVPSVSGEISVNGSDAFSIVVPFRL